MLNESDVQHQDQLQGQGISHETNESDKRNEKKCEMRQIYNRRR